LISGPQKLRLVFSHLRRSTGTVEDRINLMGAVACNGRPGSNAACSVRTRSRFTFHGRTCHQRGNLKKIFRHDHERVSAPFEAPLAADADNRGILGSTTPRGHWGPCVLGRSCSTTVVGFRHGVGFELTVLPAGRPMSGRTRPSVIRAWRRLPFWPCPGCTATADAGRGSRLRKPIPLVAGELPTHGLLFALGV